MIACWRGEGRRNSDCCMRDNRKMSYCSELLKCIFVVTVMFVEREVKKGENHLAGKRQEGLNQDDWT